MRCRLSRKNKINHNLSISIYSTGLRPLYVFPVKPLYRHPCAIMAKKGSIPPTEVELSNSTSKTDDTSSSGTQSTTASSTSSSANKTASRQEQKVRKKFDANAPLLIEAACPTIKGYSSKIDLDIEALVEDLVRYCKMVNDYPSLTLHSPVAVLQALLDGVLTDSAVPVLN